MINRVPIKDHSRYQIMDLHYYLYMDWLKSYIAMNSIDWSTDFINNLFMDLLDLSKD